MSQPALAQRTAQHPPPTKPSRTGDRPGAQGFKTTPPTRRPERHATSGKRTRTAKPITATESLPVTGCSSSPGHEQCTAQGRAAHVIELPRQAPQPPRGSAGGEPRPFPHPGRQRAGNYHGASYADCAAAPPESPALCRLNGGALDGRQLSGRGLGVRSCRPPRGGLRLGRASQPRIRRRRRNRPKRSALGPRRAEWRRPRIGSRGRRRPGTGR